MKETLAVKYRPKTLEEVVGQESILQILKRQLETHNYPHAMLFAGISGAGKTSTARAFAKAINKGYGSPIEIDAASNSGVDNVRNIIKDAFERSLDSEYKIFVIDECHALSSASWQAFLKTIEEPPEYTIFMFCTTDPQKIPDTILNRVMRFNLSRISSDKISDRLKYICQQEGFQHYSGTCDYISRICGGGMRDAIATLEKCAAYNTDLSFDNVLQALGDFSYETYFRLTNSILDENIQDVISIIDGVYNDGLDMKLFIDKYIEFILDTSKFAMVKDISVTKIPPTCIGDLNNLVCFDHASEYYFYVLEKLMKLKNDLRFDTNARTTVEVNLITIARGK